MRTHDAEIMEAVRSSDFETFDDFKGTFLKCATDPLGLTDCCVFYVA